jgi:hypothetical protein
MLSRLNNNKLFKGVVFLSGLQDSGHSYPYYEE